MKTIWEIIVAKLTSARFYIAILIILTLCYSVFKSFDILYMLLSTEIKDEKIFGLIKDVIFMLLGGFIATVSSIITLYFGRTDRTTENGGGK